jgi:hypothetical protein
MPQNTYSIQIISDFFHKGLELETLAGVYWARILLRWPLDIC